MGRGKGLGGLSVPGGPCSEGQGARDGSRMALQAHTCPLPGVPPARSTPSCPPSSLTAAELGFLSFRSSVASGNPLEWETAWPVPGLPDAEQELASVRQQTCPPGGFSEGPSGP